MIECTWFLLVQVKLRRLLRFMELKDVKSAALRSIDSEEGADAGMCRADRRKITKFVIILAPMG